VCCGVVVSRSRYTARIAQEQVSTEPVLCASGAELLLLGLVCVVVLLCVQCNPHGKCERADSCRSMHESCSHITSK
jgi:hypothetical protein